MRPNENSRCLSSFKMKIFSTEIGSDFSYKFRLMEEAINKWMSDISNGYIVETYHSISKVAETGTGYAKTIMTITIEYVEKDK